MVTECYFDSRERTPFSPDEQDNRCFVDLAGSDRLLVQLGAGEASELAQKVGVPGDGDIPPAMLLEGHHDRHVQGGEHQGARLSRFAAGDTRGAQERGICMARRVFFSFHFEKDIWRVNQVRNCNVVAGPDRAGFWDHSEYEEAKKKSPEAIDRMIRKKLAGTTVTVVLIGTETAERPWVKREIELSLGQKNGLLGIYIHHLENVNHETNFWRGEKPHAPWNIPFPAYNWDRDLDRFAREIEAAGRWADKWRATGDSGSGLAAFFDLR